MTEREMTLLRDFITWQSLPFVDNVFSTRDETIKHFNEWLIQVSGNQQPCEDTEVIKVSKGAVKARQGRFVIYDVDWLKKNFYATEEKIYGQPKQPCEDCISREDAINEVNNISLETSYDNEKVEQILRDLPSVTPKYSDEEIDKAQAVEQAYVDKMVELAVEETKRPKGKWIEVEVRNVYATLKCSVCGRVIEPIFDFCKYSYEDIKRSYPYCHCGAEMSGGEEE